MNPNQNQFSRNLTVSKRNLAIVLVVISLGVPDCVVAATSIARAEFLFSFGGSSVADGLFRNPRGVAVNASNIVFIADADNHRIQAFDSAGNFLFKFGSSGTNDGEFSSPKAVTVDGEDRIIVADTGNQRIQVFDPTGHFLFRFGFFG